MSSGVPPRAPAAASSGSEQRIAALVPLLVSAVSPPSSSDATASVRQSSLTSSVLRTLASHPPTPSYALSPSLLRARFDAALAALPASAAAAADRARAAWDALAASNGPAEGLLRKKEAILAALLALSPIVPPHSAVHTSSAVQGRGRAHEQGDSRTGLAYHALPHHAPSSAAARPAQATGPAPAAAAARAAGGAALPGPVAASYADYIAANTATATESSRSNDVSEPTSAPVAAAAAAAAAQRTAWRTGATPVPASVLCNDAVAFLQGLGGSAAEVPPRPPAALTPYTHPYAREQSKGQSKGVGLAAEADVSPGDRWLFECLCELSSLYTGLSLASTFPLGQAASNSPAEGQSPGTEGGLVRLALNTAIQAELDAYLVSLAAVQALLPPLPPPPPTHFTQHHGTSPASAQSQKQGGLTLRRLWAWAQAPLHRLRALATAVAATQPASKYPLRGGALLSALASVASVPSPSPLIDTAASLSTASALSVAPAATAAAAAASSAASALLAAAARPWLSALQTWLACGLISDPCGGELFVKDAHASQLGTASAQAKGAEAGDVWEGRFSLVPGLIPSFVSLETAKTVLLAGKSVFFIRSCCGEPGFTLSVDVRGCKGVDGIVRAAEESATVEAAISEATALPLMNTDASTNNQSAEFSLESQATRACAAASSALMRLLSTKHAMRSHLSALRMYLLLGSGEFSQALLEAGREELGRRAPATAQHHLQAVVDAAVAAVGGRAGDGAARGGSVEAKGGEAGERGGDPLLDPRVQSRVLARAVRGPGGDNERGWDIFALEYHLADSPLAAVVDGQARAAYGRLFRLLWKVRRAEGELARVWGLHASSAKTIRRMRDRATDRVAHRCHLLRNELSTFVAAVSAYFFGEVADAADARWRKELDGGEIKTFDDLISAHRRHLRSLSSSALLTGPGSAAVLAHLDRIFDICIQFRTLQVRGFAAIAHEAGRRAGLARETHDAAAARASASFAVSTGGHSTGIGTALPKSVAGNTAFERRVNQACTRGAASFTSSMLSPTTTLAASKSAAAAAAAANAAAAASAASVAAVAAAAFLTRPSAPSENAARIQYLHVLSAMESQAETVASAFWSMRAGFLVALTSYQGQQQLQQGQDLSSSSSSASAVSTAATAAAGCIRAAYSDLSTPLPAGGGGTGIGMALGLILRSPAVSTGASATAAAVDSRSGTGTGAGAWATLAATAEAADADPFPFSAAEGASNSAGGEVYLGAGTSACDGSNVVRDALLRAATASADAAAVGGSATFAHTRASTATAAGAGACEPGGLANTVFLEMRVDFNEYYANNSAVF